ncbi:pyridoxal-phosphate dependent enzyme [candidate division KSB1 bacterium]|nr:threonine synthase [candidate division KSB1 bacterium]RQW04298.1 MAG: pyridoxal-phosphate dependent enzyme [candidate division KSB1 bacterium]
MWRYRAVIPLRHDKNIVSFNEGKTPLLDIDIDGLPVKVKLDHLCPSGSFKDRGASVLVSKVKELGIQHVVEDSSGNAGAAIATYCAAAHIGCDIYVPASTSAGKLTQIEAMGARVVKIPGSRDDTARAVLQQAQHIYYASHVWNPYFLHGIKTIAYEICEQLDWSAPDFFFTPVGNGSLLLGAFIGFGELLNAGMIAKMPRLCAVQSAHCAPCAEAFFLNQKTIVPIDPQPTLAEGIAVAEPIRGAQIINAVRQSNGDFITVLDNEVKLWLDKFYKKGLYIEPTSAVVFAGLSKYKRKLGKNDTVVTIITGHGLKTNKKV